MDPRPKVTFLMLRAYTRNEARSFHKTARDQDRSYVVIGPPRVNPVRRHLRRNQFPAGAKPAGNKLGLASLHSTIGDSVMWALINIIYREYCLERLHEMRKMSH